MTILLILPMTLLGSLGAFFFKRSTERMTGLLSLLTIPSFYLGGALYLCGAMMNVALLRVMDYTVLYPMSALSYVWSMVLARLFLGEKVTWNKFLGVAILGAGVALLAG